MSEAIKLILTKGGKRIICDVLPDGEVKIQTEGYTGKSCIAETEFLKEALGEEISKQLTPAYFTTGKVEIKKHLCICG